MGKHLNWMWNQLYWNNKWNCIIYLNIETNPGHISMSIIEHKIIMRMSWHGTTFRIIGTSWGKATRAPSQYPKRRRSVRFRKVSKPRDLYLELSDRSEIWQALRQQCCRCACQISKRYNNLKYQSRGFETSRDLTKRRLFVYWDGAQLLLVYLTKCHPLLSTAPVHVS